MGSNRNTSEPQGSTPTPAETAPGAANASLNTAPDNVSKNDVGAAALEAKQRELAAQEVELQRKAADLAQETNRRDREWKAAQDRLRAQGVTAAGPVGAAVPGELLSTSTPFTGERSHWDELAVDPADARLATKMAIAAKSKAPDRLTICETQDFETIAKVKTATGYVPARTRIPAGTMDPEVMLKEWGRNVVRPYETPPPPPPPERGGTIAHVDRPNPNR